MKLHFTYFICLLSLVLLLAPVVSEFAGAKVQWNSPFGASYRLALPPKLNMIGYFTIFGALFAISAYRSTRLLLRGVRRRKMTTQEKLICPQILYQAL
jgi:hypothetical protein